MAKFLDFITEAVGKDKTHVMTFMRANPPTIGHERVVNQVKQMATDLGGDHSVILSHTHDGQKNPLTAEQKLRHAKRAFPNTNISASSPEQPNILHIASNLHKKGVNNLHVVVGQDRVKQFDELLHKYNGYEGPHGYFNFKNIQLHSAGDRDPDAEGIEGVSGTSQRKHALTGNKEMFHVGAPSAMAPEHKDELMNDIINGTVAPPPKPTKPAAKKTSKPKAEPFNPGTSVLVQHGSHSQEPIKESRRISFRQLIEKKIQMPYQEMLNSTDYPENRDEKVNHLQNANDHIAKGGPEKVDAALQKQYKSNPHVEHLKQYSESSFDLNHALLDHHNEGGDPNEMPMIADWDHIEGLDNALNHSKTKKPMTVFSGVGFNPGKMAEKHPENNLYMPSYTSTSIDPKVASTFSKPLYKDSTGETMDHMYDPDKDEKEEGADNHILRINIPKGHSGAYMGGTSSLPEEKEFLLPRQQTMKIHPTPETHEFTDGYVTHRLHIWDATPVPTKLPKPVTEETVSGGLMVRGFGDVSGNPAVQDNPLQQYINTNALAKDQQNGALMKMMKDSKHDILSFKAFDPTKSLSRDKTLQYWDTDENGDPLKSRKKK